MPPRANRSWAQPTVSYSCGTIRVLDREGLEEESCECYAIIRKEFDRLPGG